ncbi:MAG: hypothetical protein WC099_02790 [Candidatus Paceibacterota bacterium]
MDSINYQELAREIIQQQKKEQIPQGHKEAMISVLREQMIQQQQFATKQSDSTIQSSVQTIPSNLEERNLPSYAETASSQIKQEVERLIHTTLEKGLHDGIAEAIKADPFVIDMYHDALAEHIVEQMKNKGIF